MGARAGINPTQIRRVKLQNCEKEIADTEEKIRLIDKELSLPETGTNLTRCQELALQREQQDKKLNELMELWEILADTDS